ncbi:MAG TPA: hypothetical protein VFD94_08380 [Jatrophihabitans sp.]|nr:hypothetical protein [Jatrophihabitans sp.]
MRREPNTSQRLLAVLLAGVLAVLIAGCSSGKKKSSVTLPPVASNLSAITTSASVPSTSAAPSTPATTAAATGLSGSWSGQYSGAFTGTFTLTWTQTGSTLAGTITLSTSGTVPLNGTVSGSHISFGTVGSAAITYSGTVSGNSMSGSYQINGAAGGPWSATKT